VDYFAVGVIGYEFMLGRVRPQTILFEYLFNILETLQWKVSQRYKRPNIRKTSAN